MAATEDIAITRLGAEDAAAGLLLSSEARWNQTVDDWRFFLRNGIVFGVRDDATRLIATAALLPYTAGNAWISMVLVSENWRRRGIATKLVVACLSAAAKMSLTSWLDATPAGAAVYGPMGFAPTLELRRLRLENGDASTPSPWLDACDPSALIARDRGVMGFARQALLADFAARTGSRLVKQASAIALVRDGRTARHIGPLYAESADDALALVQGIVRSERSPLLLDAVLSQAKFLDGLVGSGWSIERPFQRMRFGNVEMQAAEMPFAVAGPEFG